MNTTATPERKYALTRIATGDYILPSNDQQTIWRIVSYVDGPSSGLDWPRDRTVWSLRRWTGRLRRGRPWPTCPDCADDMALDSDRWGEVACCLPTRRAAIDRALTTSPKGKR